MPIDKDIRIHLSCQQFECSRFDVGEERSVLFFKSNRRSDEVVCPFCGGTARWVQELLRWRLPVSAVHRIMGFLWDTIRRIPESMKQEALDWRREHNAII